VSRASAGIATAKILTVVGARPQFVKAAPISRAVAACPDLTEVIVHTGQHFDANMSDVFFEELGIPRPAHRLDIHSGSHGVMTGRMMIALEDVMLTEKPDMVLVYGDTNSTFAAALCAAKLYIPIAHVEAGVRSFDKRMPEEVNRVMTDYLSTLMFCPTPVAVKNLAAEGLTQGVHNVGDVMYDLTLMLAQAAATSPSMVQALGLTPGAYALATLHRQATTDEPGALAKALDYLRTQSADLPVLLPLHPRTRVAAANLGLSFDGLRTIDPVGPIEMQQLLADCAVVYTDSGGLQKEAYFHGKPCVTMRDTTEWVETIEAGWNRLWTTPEYAPRRPIPDYGTGQAAEAIVGIIAGSIAYPDRGA
jgi:UDP-GlcNAc3NAcA epimerase